MNTDNDLMLLKATDVAKILNISRSFAYRLMRTGNIPTVRFGRAVRVRPSDLEEFKLRNLFDQDTTNTDI